MKFSILMEIFFELLTKRKVTATYLAEKYETSVRTIYRYVDDLSFCIPVTVNRGRNGGICLSDSFKLPKGFMTKDEYEAAIEALDAMYSQFPEEKFLQAKNKLSAQVKSETRDLTVTGDVGAILVDSGTWGDTSRFSEKIRLYESAVKERHVLDIDYRSRVGEQSRRKIEPHVLVFTKNAWYVYAFCHKQRSFALFPVGKILSILKTDERFIRRPFADTDIQPPIKQATPNIEVELEIADDALSEAQAWLGADYLEQKDKKWHAVFTAANEEILAKWIVGLGGNVKVLSPSSLIKKVKKLAKETLSLYV
jgi:predicted DNA-binding transcriptional regulator YafY